MPGKQTCQHPAVEILSHISISSIYQFVHVFLDVAQHRVSLSDMVLHIMSLTSIQFLHFHLTSVMSVDVTGIERIK